MEKPSGTTSAKRDEWIVTNSLRGVGGGGRAEGGKPIFNDYLSDYARAKGIDVRNIDPGNPGSDFYAWQANRLLAPHGGDVNAFIDSLGFADFGQDRPTYHEDSGQITGNEYNPKNAAMEYAKIPLIFASLVAGGGLITGALAGAAGGGGALAGGLGEATAGIGAGTEYGALQGATMADAFAGYGGSMTGANSLGAISGWQPPIGLGSGVGTAGNFAPEVQAMIDAGISPEIASQYAGQAGSVMETSGAVTGGGVGGSQYTLGQVMNLMPNLPPGASQAISKILQGDQSVSLSDIAKYGSIAQSVSGLLSTGASLYGASQAAGGQQKSIDSQRAMFDVQNAQQAPYRQAGYTALGQIGALTAGGLQSPLLRPFGAGDLNANLAPNWRFALDQGIGATQNANNAVNSLVSGNTQKGIIDYTLNKAGDQYQQAYQNYTNNQTNIYNRLSSIAGLGQVANQQSSQLTGQIAPSIGSAYAGQGAAQAAGTVGAANNLAQGASSALGWYALPSMLSMGA